MKLVYKIETVGLYTPDVDLKFKLYTEKKFLGIKYWSYSGVCTYYSIFKEKGISSFSEIESSLLNEYQQGLPKTMYL